MLVYEDQCVGCPPEIGCRGATCPNRNVPVEYCDRCGDAMDEVFCYEGEEICEECLKQIFLREA